MDRLVKILILSTCILHNCIAQDNVKRSIFSWSKEAEVKEPSVVPGYLPPVTIHKYHGVQINPANGPPLYLSGSDAPQSNDAISVNHFQSGQLSPEYSSQLELLRTVAPFLPDDGRLEDYDVTALLPYVDLISEDALARIQFAVESEKSQKESKLLKLIGFLRYLKELKLKPFKAAANFGATLLNKKKQTVSNILHLGSSPVVTTQPPTLPPLPYPHPGGYPIHHPAVRPPHFIPSQPSFPIHSPPLNDEAQQVQQPLDQQQPVAPPSAVNSDNRVDPSFGPQFVPSYPQLTPASTFLAYPHYPAVAPPRNDYVEPPAYFSYPEQFQSPSSYQPRYQYPTNAESTPAPQQQKMRPNTYPEEPYPSKSSNVATYQTTEQPINFHYQHFASPEKSQKYPSTPADTYANGDLAGSASDNVEKVKETLGPVVNVETPVIRKEELSVAKPENHHFDSSTKPKTTKLRIIETRPPVVVYPETSAESKSTDSESTSLPLPLATISSAHQSSK